MSAGAEFRKAIKMLVLDLIKEPTLQCTVKAVDKDKKTLTVSSERDKVDYYNVRLMSLSGDQLTDGITVFPKVGSTVIIAMIEGVDTMYYVSNYGEVESYEIKVAGIKFYIDKDNILFNDGNLGGLVKIEQLKNNQDAIKNYLTALVSAISSGLTAVGIGTAANGGTGAAAFNSAISGQQIVFQEMENTKVKH